MYTCILMRPQASFAAFVLVAVVALVAGPAVCSADSSGQGNSITAPSDSAGSGIPPATTSISIPLRVDYRDREDAFDLDLLGVATGMCSLSGDCDACLYRDINPCQVADQYGKNTSICQLPSILGGAVDSKTLCGIGATTDIIVPDSSGSSKGTVVGGVTAFRNRDGMLMLTLTARCGWVLKPSLSAVLQQSIGDGSAAAAGITSAMVVTEGEVSYLGERVYFAAPAPNAGRNQYSCYTTTLELRRLSSKCQALDLDLNLRLSVQRMDALVMGAIVGWSSPVVVCEEGSGIMEAVARLEMRGPQAGAQAAIARTAAASASYSSSQEAAVRQQLFSNGVAATSSYTASVDPRDPAATEWLKLMSSQAPLVTVTATADTLSFLVGSVRKDLRSGLPAGGDAAAPLLQSSLYLESCGRQSISAVVAAVVSVLAPLGVTEKHISDVVCLQSPYITVDTAELPPCASYTSVLFNVTLDISLEASTGTTSSVLAAGSGSLGSAASGGTASPQVLADALVEAQLAAPWTCLSTESQMRMAREMQVDVRLPKGPGVEAISSAAEKLPPAVDPAPSEAATPSPEAASGAGGAPGGVEAPSPRSSGGVVEPGGAAGRSSSGLGAVGVAAVAVAVALAVTVVLVAIFAIRSVKKSRAAAKEAAASAAAANTAAAEAAARGGHGAVPSKFAGMLPPTPKPFKQESFSKPPPLGAEPSYASTAYDADESAAAVAAATGAAASAAAEGVRPWASKDAARSSGGGLTPAASAAALEPFAAAVEAAAVAAAASGAGSSSETFAAAGGGGGTAGRGLMQAAAADDDDDDEEGDVPLSSIRGRPMSPRPASSARLQPVTPPPISTGGGAAAVRPPASTVMSPPAGQPPSQRRGRTLWMPRLGSGSSGAMSAIPEAAQTAATGSTVWSNALYDLARQSEGDSASMGGAAP